MEYTNTKMFSRMAFVALAFLLLAGCQKPEPDPEPPTPPIVNTDTLPVNKFVGTWVLCGQSNVNEEPLCACADSLNSVDTLIFTSGNLLTIRHGSQHWTFTYDYTPSFLLFYEQDEQLYPQRKVYSFRVEGTELKITGYLPGIQGSGSQKISCFVKIGSLTENPAVVSEVPVGNRFLGTWVSCCWTSDLNEDPDDTCIDSWSGDTLVFTENKMIQKGWGGFYENEYEYTNTCSYLVYFRENLGCHQPNFINKTKFINDSVLFIYAWEYPAYIPTGGQYYNVSYKKVQ